MLAAAPMQPRHAVLSTTIACALGCTSPQAGIHAVVTMRDADFDEEHTFDHLTVTATIGERRADACLFPADAVGRALPLDEPSKTGCADLRTQPWNGSPTAASWALQDTPRTVNVEAEDGEEVVVTVVGGLGGRIGTVRGEGKGRASASFDRVDIELTPDQKVFPEGCDARLEPSFPESFDAKYRLCDALVSDCPALKPGLQRSPAVFCLDDGSSRVRNAPEITCGVTTGDASIWHTPALPKVKSCLRMFVRGHFVRCIKGDPLDAGGCTVTTDCAPQPTSIWTRDVNDIVNELDSAAMHCLPPVAVPITLSFELALPEAGVVYGLRQSVDTASEGACFLDVESFTGTYTDCSK
jgi:hypothetical protein